MNVTSILPKRVEREKSWAVAVGLLAALSPNVIGQWNLAVGIGWHPYLAAALPIASELYATMAARVWSAIPREYREQKKTAAWNMAAGIVLSFALNGLAEAVAFKALSVSLWLVLLVAAVPTICAAVLLHMAMSGHVESVAEAEETPEMTSEPAEVPKGDDQDQDPAPKRRSTVRVSPANVEKAAAYLVAVEDPSKVTGTDLETVLPRLSPRSRREALDQARKLLSSRQDAVQDTLDLLAA
ncbi:hypothetical protein [Streptosporangium pseudovulgare]|nr:hypothetical protein [Streptosporangium pseudovulgare]